MVSPNFLLLFIYLFFSGRYAYRDFTEHPVPAELNPLTETYKYIPNPKLDELRKLIDERQEQKKWKKSL